MTYSQRIALEAKMTEQFEKRLAELAKMNSKTAEDMGRYARTIKALALVTLVSVILAGVVFVLLLSERKHRNEYGPFKVGYSDHGVPASPEGFVTGAYWDHCQGVDTLEGPVICIVGPPPTVKDTPFPTPKRTPANYARPATETVADAMLPTTERLGLPTATTFPHPARSVKPDPDRPVDVPHVSMRMPRGAAPTQTSYRVKAPSVSHQVAGSAEERLQDHLIEDIVTQAGLCGVSPGIGIRLVATESGFRQFDKHGKPLRSHSGAIGLTQIKLASAREISPTLDIEWNPTDNLKAGFCYLSSRKGTWREKVLSYRLGESRKVTTAEAHAYADAILAGEAQ